MEVFGTPKPYTEPARLTSLPVLVMTFVLVTPKRLSKEEKCFLREFQQNTHYCALQRTVLLKFTLLKSPQTSKALIFPPLHFLCPSLENCSALKDHQHLSLLLSLFPVSPNPLYSSQAEDPEGHEGFEATFKLE